MLGLRCLALGALLTCVASVKTQMELNVNPIRRVLNMLQVMSKKVNEEGEAEQALFDKFMCYCQTSQRALIKSIAEAETKIPQLQSDIEETTAEQNQLKSDIAQAQKDKEAAERSIAEATSIREKEADAHRKENTQDTANVRAMGKALASLRSGASASFLQTFDAALLRKLTMSSDLPEWDRRSLATFLSTEQRDQESDGSEEPSSSEIIGIIEQLKETMEKDVAAANEAEQRAVDAHALLVKAKKKEIEALAKDLETKTSRLGEVGVELVTLSQALADTKKVLEKDSKFLEDLKKGCKEKQEEWHERATTRSQEKAAIAETINILNHDDTTHLFKKTFPVAASFLQVQETDKDLVQEARQVLLKPSIQGPRDPRLAVISMAMRGKKVNFDKVLALMDKMVSLLGREQKDDDAEKRYCRREIDTSEDEKSFLAETASDIGKTIANSKEGLEALKKEVDKIAAGIKALDDAVADATAQRKAQNTAFVEELASNNAAIEVLKVAKDRLKSFYQPALVQEPRHEHDHSVKGHKDAEARINPNQGLEDAEALQAAFSFLQESIEVPAAAPDSKIIAAQVVPKAASNSLGAAPETWGSKSAKGEGTGILSMLGALISDVQKQVSEMQKEEQDAQFEYEQFMADSSEKRAIDARAISAKESAKAEAESNLQQHHKDLKMTGGRAEQNDNYLASLHVKCDWLLANFKVRREARTSEIDALRQAKQVLTGADADSFLQLQTATKRNLRSGRR